MVEYHNLLDFNSMSAAEYILVSWNISENSKLLNMSWEGSVLQTFFDFMRGKDKSKYYILFITLP